MNTQDSTGECTSEKILRLISLADEAEALIKHFYCMELSGEIRRDRVQAGKLKLIELRAAVVFFRIVRLFSFRRFTVYLFSLQFTYYVNKRINI